MTVAFGDERLPTRFWSKMRIDDVTGCWLWLGARYSNGYGHVYWQGKGRLLHRVIYAVLVGPIPDGLQIDHVTARGCLYRNCGNPAHLEAVSQRENLLRSEKTLPGGYAARQTCSKGHPFDEANTLLRSSGRRCRICWNEYHRARRR